MQSHHVRIQRLRGAGTASVSGARVVHGGQSGKCIAVCAPGRHPYLLALARLSYAFHEEVQPVHAGKYTNFGVVWDMRKIKYGYMNMFSPGIL